VSSALIVVDMLNPYDHEDAESLMDSVRGMVGDLAALIESAHGDDLPVIYVNDHHDDWTAGPKEIAERALAGRAPELVAPILPGEDVPFLVKARHSIFFETLLDYRLRDEEITRIVLGGQVTEQCILYSALDGYLRGYEMVVATDAIAHIDEELAQAALRMMEGNMHAELAPGATALEHAA
jgi:nicotinamidase-related amidase